MPGIWKKRQLPGLDIRAATDEKCGLGEQWLPHAPWVGFLLGQAQTKNVWIFSYLQTETQFLQAQGCRDNHAGPAPRDFLSNAATKPEPSWHEQRPKGMRLIPGPGGRQFGHCPAVPKNRNRCRHPDPHRPARKAPPPCIAPASRPARPLLSAPSCHPEKR